MRDDGKQGSRSGSTFQEMRSKARSGSFAGKKYPHDTKCEQGYGAPDPRMAGQGSGVVRARPISTPRTGNSPYERQVPTKPGHM